MVQYFAVLHGTVLCAIVKLCHSAHLTDGINRLLMSQMPLMKFTGMFLNLILKVHLRILVKRSICANVCKACTRPVLCISIPNYSTVYYLSWATKHLMIMPNCLFILKVLNQQLKLRSDCYAHSS